MKVKVVRISDDYVLNIRNTDELLDDGVFKSEAECSEAENAIKKVGRWYVNAETVLFPVR